MKESFAPPEKELESRFDHPDDQLETDEEVEIKKRERAFLAEGKFNDMLGLKVTLETLTHKFGMIGTLNLPVHQFQSLINGVLDDPRMYGVSVLKIPSDKIESMGDEELAAKAQEYLENEYTPAWMERIHDFEIDIRKYEVGQNSKALNRILSGFEEMKKELQAGHWRNAATLENTVKGYVQGMTDVLSMTLGSRSEDEYVQKKFDSKIQPERKRS